MIARLKNPASSEAGTETTNSKTLNLHSELKRCSKEDNLARPVSKIESSGLFGLILQV